MKRDILNACLIGTIFLGAVSFAGPDQGQTDPNSLVKLQDYLRYAALHNAGLKSSFEQWKAAVEAVPQARALPDPRFTYGYFIEEVETRVGPQQHRFGITQIFPWFGKIEARTDAAAAAAKAARKRYEGEKLKLFFEVKKTFYEYAYLAEAVAIARENLELVKRFEEVARAKYVTSAAGHPDVIRAQVELATIEERLKALEELRQPIVAQLSAILNRDNSGMLPWPDREKFQAVAVDRKWVVGRLRAQNPQLQALDFELESARSRLELAKKRSYPDFGLGVDWIQTGSAVSSGVPGSGADPVVLMFSLNLPIWRQSYEAARSQARAQVRQKSQQKRDLENTIVARSERVLYEFEDSARKVNLYRNVLIPKAEELLGASETAYKAGSIDFLSLIDAQRKLLQYGLLHQRAVADNAQRLAELEMLTGEQVPQLQMKTVND
ncbi:MAG: TolC family protein [Phycisphaerales bacterium]|nr:MAG: TolC family protein [Phycisphaerales bacterium]